MSVRTAATVVFGRVRLLTTRSFRGGGEMAFRAICVALLLATFLTAGCGTVANLARSRPEEGGRRPFGGVEQDVWCINKAANGELGVRTHPKAESGQYPQLALMLFCAVDLPFSLIGDVVTWPYAAAYSFINRPVPTPPVTLSPAETRPQPSPPEPLTMPRNFP
jgi:uncharacterized protein YceK